MHLQTEKASHYSYCVVCRSVLVSLCGRAFVLSNRINMSMCAVHACVLWRGVKTSVWFLNQHSSAHLQVNSVMIMLKTSDCCYFAQNNLLKSLRAKIMTVTSGVRAQLVSAMVSKLAHVTLQKTEVMLS